MLLTTSDHATLTLPNQTLCADMKLLLIEFEDVFQLPIGLPPIRLQDHKIPLKDDAQEVKFRPY